MQNEIIVSLPKPHAAQQQILKESKRFNVVCNGRRWGKTTLSTRLVKPSITSGSYIGYWSPTYKDTNEVWKELKHRLLPIIKSKNEQVKQIELITGGLIDFWSMDDPDSGRGRKYHRAIIDEFEKAPKAHEAWQYTIRPTLADYVGDAWMLSTPKGINRPFYDLFYNREKYDNWMSWQMPTSTNPYIPKSEIEEAEKQLDPITFKQEFLAEFVTTADKPYIYCFREDHIQKCELDTRNTVYLSFDFNVDPITAIAGNIGTNFIHICHEFRLSNSNTYELCAHIKNIIGNCHFLVTGDATGRSRTVQTKGNFNNYHIIMQELGLSSTQIKVPSKNPPLTESRTLVNSIFARHPDVKIDPSCKYVIDDLRFVQAKEDGSIDKAKDAHMSHLLDTVRYLFSTFKGNFIQLNR